VYVFEGKLTMKKITLADLNLLDIGNKIQIAGLIMSDERTDYYCYLPAQKIADKLALLEMDLGDWESFIRQTDLLETEILAKDKTGKFAKVILRKSNRQIDAGVSWKVFHRDNYTCRYCGVTAVPMTVDHIITWEDSGPTIELNLVTSCRKCNKVRSNMGYREWLDSNEYTTRSVTLSESVKQENIDLLKKLDSIPRKQHIISR